MNPVISAPTSWRPTISTAPDPEHSTGGSEHAHGYLTGPRLGAAHRAAWKSAAHRHLRRVLRTAADEMTRTTVKATGTAALLGLIDWWNHH